MTEEHHTVLLRLLDFERRTIVYPGAVRHTDENLVKDVSADGRRCDIVYSSCAEANLDQIIGQQIADARAASYDIEWKTYGHDRPSSLPERLLAAGFTAEDTEAFLVLRLPDPITSQSSDAQCDVRRIIDRTGLEDYRRVVEEVWGKSAEGEILRYASMLEHHPENLSVYVGYVDGEPAATGRVYFHKDSQFAALFGGNTRVQFRRRGLFTQMVMARMREALERGIVNICVDALPTSEPILKKIGFEFLTNTRPFCFTP